MVRLILIAVAVLALVWLVRRALAGGSRQAPQAAPAELVACARCGVNLPRGEAHADGARLYCSEEHRRLGPREG